MITSSKEEAHKLAKQGGLLDQLNASEYVVLFLVTAVFPSGAIPPNASKHQVDMVVIMFDPSEGTQPLVNTAQPAKVNNELPASVWIEPPNIVVMSDGTLHPPPPVRANERKHGTA